VAIVPPDETRAVVAHVQGGLAVHVGEGDGHPAGLGVLGHVGQGLLGDPEQGDLGVRAERPGRAGHGGGGRQAGLLGHPPGQPPQGLAQGRRPQLGRAQVPDQPPGLGQVVGGRPPGPLQVAAGLGGPVGQLGLGRLELEDDADKGLGQGVVDVAGQALALGQPAALPLGGRELAAGRLQLLDQPPPLVALLDDPGDPDGEQAPERHRDEATDHRPRVLRQRPSRHQHLPPDDGDAEDDGGRDGQGQAQVAEDLRVQHQQEGEEGGVDAGQDEPEAGQPGQVDQDQPGPLLANPEPLEPQVPAGQERAQPEQRPALAGGRRVEQGQGRGQRDQGVDGGVPDPAMLVPGVDAAGGALVAQPDAPLFGCPAAMVRDAGPRRGAPDGGLPGQPFG
jgi:hypothetical protein